MSKESQTEEKNISDLVLKRVNKFTELGEIKIPKDYSTENSLKSAYLILSETTDKNNKPVLSTCSTESIANALLDMCIQGLSPVKKQCSFVAFGGKLKLIREYHGTLMLARRYGGVKKFAANIIYEGDEFLYDINPQNGVIKITKHVQKFENININKIAGAYAILTFNDDTTHTEIMTIAQIRQAWLQGYAKGDSKAHKNFPDQMAIKTVIGRACKLFISSSDDSIAFDTDETDDIVLETSNEIVQENGVVETVSFEDAKIEEKKEPDF